MGGHKPSTFLRFWGGKVQRMSVAPTPDRSARCLLTAALLLLAAIPSASAQHIRGRVLDVGSNRPIPAVVLTLHAGDSSVVASSVSDAGGAWRLNAPRPGDYYITARRLGYEPWVTQTITIAADAALESILRLQQVAITLDPVTARAAAMRQNLEYAGFFDRQRSNFGHFLGPDAIDRRQAARVTDLLTAIPGVQLFSPPNGGAGPAQIGLRGSSVTDGVLCRPRVFVDGLMYAKGDARLARLRPADATEQADLEQRMDESISLDDIGHPSMIAGIEVYRSATQVPVQFGGTSVETLCGVIVVWTRSGRQMPSEKR